jgi:hypothetical protein
VISNENFQPLVDIFLERGERSFLDVDFDIASIRVLGTEFLSFYRINSAARIEEFMNQLQGSAQSVIMLLPRREVSPEFDYKSVYASHELVCRFKFFHELESKDTLNPVIFASDSFYLDRGQIVHAFDLEVFPSTVLGNESESVRTWIGKGGLLHKSELASVDFFERSQVAQEGYFLSQFQMDNPGNKSFPRLEKVSYGRAIVESVRELVPGRALNENDYGNLHVVELFHSACLRFSSKGFFHNDLRPWNLLFDGSKIELVDFADTSKRDNDLTGLHQIEGYIGTALVLLGKMKILPVNFASTIKSLIDAKFSYHQWSEMWLNLPVKVDYSKLLVLDDPQVVAREILSEITAAHV